MKTLFGLNAAQWLSLLRTASKIGGTVLMMTGALTSDQVTALQTAGAEAVGGLMVAAPILCDLYTHTIGATVARIKNAGGAAAAPNTPAATMAPPAMKAMSHWLVTGASLALLLPLLGACTTAPSGQKIVDPNVLAAVQAGAVAVCGIAPTASAVANLYTTNSAVTTTETAIALACATLKPNSVVPATVAPPVVAPAATTPSSG
jgi:hypothetical protein